MRKITFRPLLLAVISILILCSPSYAKITPLKVTFIDVGPGDCILIQTPDDGIKNNGKCEGKIILIDGGEKAGDDNVVIPYLKSHGINTDRPIDVLIMTHSDKDHVGGLIPVIKNYQVKMILDPGFNGESNLYKKTFVDAASKECGAAYYHPLVGTLISKEGDALDWGSELQVRVLHSSAEADEVNNASIVIRLKYGEVSFLFPGDIAGKDRENKDPSKPPKYAEKELLDKFSGEIRSTVLKVPHHGSETSSTIAFISAVSPRYAIICAGNKEYNGTLLPQASVLKRYKDKGIEIYRTDRDDQDKLTSETPRDDNIIFTTHGTLKGITIEYEELL